MGRRIEVKSSEKIRWKYTLSYNRVNENEWIREANGFPHVTKYTPGRRGSLQLTEESLCSNPKNSVQPMMPHLHE